MSDQGCATYRTDLYYISRRVDGALWQESVVSPWRFYMTWVLTPWRWHKWKEYHVLVQKEDLRLMCESATCAKKR